MSKTIDLVGTSESSFKIEKAGVLLKNATGNLSIRATDDSADAGITADLVSVSGDILEINSDAAGTGDDWKLTLQRPATGMTANVALTFPADDGTTGQVLATDGSGVLSWTSAGNTSLCVKADTTTLAFDSSSSVDLFSTGAADIIRTIQVIVDTSFNTVATVSIGITGTASKYAAATKIDLTAAAGSIFEINPALAAQGVEALKATYSANSATAGSARILIDYVTPA
jgi:hypothetical protein